MTRTNTRFTLFLIFTFAFGCNRAEDSSAPTPSPNAKSSALPENDGQSQVEHGKGSSSEEIYASSAPTRWVKIRPAQDSSMLSASCVTRAMAHASGNVASPFQAQVQKVYVQVGDVVKKGESIAEISSPEILRAAALFLGTRSRLKIHKERLVNLQDLQREGMVRSAAVFEQKALIAELSAESSQALAILRMAKINTNAVAKVVRSSRSPLTSPVDGIVASLHAHPGEVLDGTSPLAKIVGRSSSRVEVHSPVALTPGESASILLSDGQSIALNPIAVSSIVDPETGMYKTWFNLKDAEKELGDGQQCTVLWKVSDDIWEAPSASVQTTSEGSKLWRKRGGEIENIAIQVLKTSGASVLLQGPFQPEDYIAADSSLIQIEAK